MSVRVLSVVHPDLPPFTMSDRFRHDITYFMSIPGENGIPALPAGDYWIRLSEAREWLDCGVFRLVSPLDSGHRTEAELTEEQEDWLEWMVLHNIEHVRLG